MGCVYVRENSKLAIRFKDNFGKWRSRVTKFKVGQERDAEKLLTKTESNIKAQKEFDPKATGPLTVKTYGDRWIERRRVRGLASADDDASRLKRYFYPMLGAMNMSDVRPRHIREWVEALGNVSSRKKGTLAPRTIRSAFALVHTMMRDANADELIDSNPCVLPAGVLPKKVDKNPLFRRDASFSEAELVKLITNEAIPVDRRVLYSILFLTGQRFGEMAALSWSDYETGWQPLGKIHVAKSYSTRQKKVKSTKTEVNREVPVHPVLADVLAKWKNGPWKAMIGRDPTSEDLIVPSRLGKHRSVNFMLKRFHEDCERVGVKPRRQHDARRTFVSLARAGGADTVALKAVTHGRSQEILDMYTTMPWPALCAAVLCLKVPLPVPPELPPSTDGGEPAPIPAPVEVMPQANGGETCYDVVTVAADRAAEQEKGPQPWMVASLGKWRGVRDSNPWPPA